MNNYACPHCGQLAKKPPWLVARESGFDPGRHCVLLANRKGRLVNCLRWTKKNPSIQCDIDCPTGKAYSKKETDQHGRTREVYFDPERRSSDDR